MKIARANWGLYAGSLVVSATTISLYRMRHKAAWNHTSWFVKRRSIGIIHIAVATCSNQRYLLCKYFYLISARVLGHLQEGRVALFISPNN